MQVSDKAGPHFAHVGLLSVVPGQASSFFSLLFKIFILAVSFISLFFFFKVLCVSLPSFLNLPDFT